MLIVTLAFWLIGLQSSSHLDVQSSRMLTQHPATPAHPATLIRFPARITGSVYDFLSVLAVTDRVPLGLVLDKTTKKRFCNATINIAAGEISMSSLVELLRKSLVDQDITILDEAINIQPKDMDQSTASLLGVRIPEFHISSSTHNSAGVSLWFYFRSVVAPGEATAYAGRGSFSSDNINIQSSKGRTLRDNLNLIITRGLGGAWILDSTNVAMPLSENRMPYQTYDYSGDEETIRRTMSCPR